MNNFNDNEAFGWTFSDRDVYASRETDTKIATITKLKDGRWRWAIHNKKKKLLAKRDGWWGVCETLYLAMAKAEKQL